MTTTGGRSGLLRDFRHPQQASYVELLLDVVYVYVLIRLTALLAEHLSWHGAYQALLLFLAMWWLWYRTAWTTNRYNPARPAIQSMVIFTMLGSLLMATALPRAFTDWGLLFASIYVAAEVIRYLWLTLLGGDWTEQRSSVCILFWAVLSAGPWLIGAVQPATARTVWWSLALFLDYLGGILDFPTPRLGRAGLRQHKVAEGHLTDRYRQFLIIAFGETILAAGREFRAYRFQEIRSVALLVSFAITVLLWQIYIYRAGELLAEAIAAAATPTRVSELAWYSHLVMVAGVTLSGVGDRLIIIGPLGRSGLDHVLVIFGGPALFLLGRAILDYTAFSHVSWSRPIGLVALAALAPAALRLPPIAAAGLAAAVLVGIAAANVIAWRLFPRIPSPPR